MIQIQKTIIKMNYNHRIAQLKKILKIVDR